MPKNAYTMILLLLLSGFFSPAGFAYEYEMESGTEPYSPDTAGQEQAGPTTYGAQVGKKLGGGFSNVALGWLEIPKSIINTGNKVNWMFGVTGGLGLGLLNTLGRALTGVVDIVTFPLPTKPMPKPYFIWDDFDENTTYGPAFRLYE